MTAREAQLTDLLRRLRRCLDHAAHGAEAEHDDPDGNGYFELSLYLTFTTANKLVAEIDAALATETKSGPEGPPSVEPAAPA